MMSHIGNTMVESEIRNLELWLEKTLDTFLEQDPRLVSGLSTKMAANYILKRLEDCIRINNREIERKSYEQGVKDEQDCIAIREGRLGMDMVNGTPPPCESCFRIDDRHTEHGAKLWVTRCPSSCGHECHRGKELVL